MPYYSINCITINLNTTLIYMNFRLEKYDQNILKWMGKKHK